MGARFSAPVQTDPGAYTVSCTVGTGSFPGVKRPGCGADHLPQSKCRGHEKVGLYLYSPSGPQWPATGTTLPLSYPPDMRSNARRTPYKTSVIFISFTPKSWYANCSKKNLEFDENVLSGPHSVTCGRRGMYI